MNDDLDTVSLQQTEMALEACVFLEWLRENLGDVTPARATPAVLARTFETAEWRPRARREMVVDGVLQILERFSHTGKVDDYTLFGGLVEP